VKFYRPIFIDFSQEDPLAILSGETILDFSAIQTTGTAITIFSSGPISYPNTRLSLRGIDIIGPGRSTPSRGIKLHNSAMVGLEDIAVHEFGDGIVFGNRTWSNTVRNAQFYHCNNAIYYPSSMDSGECLRFFGCNFFNSETAVKVEYGAELNFFGCSFDYATQKLFDLSHNARVNLYGCHIEDSVERQSQPKSLITLEDERTQFTMFGGTIWISGMEREPDMTAEPTPLFDSSGHILLNGVRLQNVRGSSLMVGPGSIKLRDLSTVNCTKKIRKQNNIFSPWPCSNKL